MAKQNAKIVKEKQDEKQVYVLLKILAALRDLNKKIDRVETNTRASEEEVRHIIHKDNEVVNVSLRITISRIEDIDTVKQEFTSEFFMAAVWEEPNLDRRVKVEDVNWDEEWDPRISFENVVEIKSLQRKHEVLPPSEGHSRNVQLSYRVKGRFKTVFSLRGFPFDYQTLSIAVSSKWTDAVVQFSHNVMIPSAISCSNFPDQEWELHDYVFSEIPSTDKKSFGHFSLLKYSSCEFKVQIRRKYSYFLYNVVLLMFLITSLSFVSFSIESSEVGERLGVCLTLLLTAVAFNFVVSGSLPPVSYLTLLDKYVLGCLLFIFTVTIDISVGGSGWISNKKMFDLYSSCALCGLFICIQVIYAMMSLLAVRRTKKALDDRRNGEQKKIKAEQEISPTAHEDKQNTRKPFLHPNSKVTPMPGTSTAEPESSSQGYSQPQGNPNNNPKTISESTPTDHLESGLYDRDDSKKPAKSETFRYPMSPYNEKKIRFVVPESDDGFQS